MSAATTLTIRPAAAPAEGVAVGLFTALQDLKRQYPAHYRGRSIATQLFRRAWSQLLTSERSLAEVARRTVATATAQVLFPGCDAGFWPHTGLREQQVAELLRASIAETCAGAGLADATLAALGACAEDLAADYFGAAQAEATLPRALDLLCRQPRAGATRPGFQRLVLTPAELHGEHCLLTAVYAYLSADGYGAQPEVAFLAGLAHHLHNALLPDCGFAGEMLLGEHLAPVIDTLRERALEQLPDALADATRAALRHHETIATPEGEAISAGDVLDRVLDVKWRTRAAAVTDADILGDLDLVHAGPLKDFQVTLLNAYGLWTAH